MRFKIKKQNPSTKLRTSKGFALLFSVLLSSLLLTIGLSIFSIALKELSISTAVRQSIHAFYAADSGRECAIYWDVKGGQIPTMANNGRYTGEIACGLNSNIVLSNNNPDSSPTTIPTTKIITDVNFTVDIERKLSGSDIKTTVTAYGYDSANDDRVERAIEQTY